MPSMFSQPFSQWLGADGTANRQIEVDAVVIGSGYGGAVAALRLAEEGWNVLVLERGAEFRPGDFPNHLGLVPKFLRAHGLHGTVGNLGGLFDFRVGLGMASLVANGLGGGSLINAGVMMRPDADVFAQPPWPSEIRHGLDERRHDAAGDGLGMDAAFARAAAMLQGEIFDDAVRPASLPMPALPAREDGEIPVSRLPKAQALKRMGEAMRKRLASDGAGNPDGQVDFDAKPARLTIDLEKCVRCGDCFTGCNHEGAKRTLLTTYLKQARARGATLLTSSFVYAVSPQEGPHGLRWLVRVLPAENELETLRLEDAVRSKGHTLRARLVVVAAGTFGSTELLMRSQRLSEGFPLSPALGTRLSGNGDSLSVLADLDQPVEGVGLGADSKPAREVGPTITTLLDLRGRRQIDQRVVIQEGATPGALARLYQELLATTWTLRHLGTWGRKPRSNAGLEPLAATDALARHTQMLLAMGHDGSKGRLVWMPQMDGVVPFWNNVETEAAFQRQEQLFGAAERAGEGVHLHPPTWRLVQPELAEAADGELPPATMLSVHPLGGCPMGDGFESGVVNHLGQVWRGPYAVWHNLYVLDGSIVPTSLGCNPLWTITALAERAMAQRAQGLVRPSGPPPAEDIPCTSGDDEASRVPQAISREGEPEIAMELLERLERRRLPLRGALRDAMGMAEVESDIRLSMRSADWLRVWDQPPHRIAGMTGTLRLAGPPAPDRRQHLLAAPAAPERQLEYDVAAGYIDLFSPESGSWRAILRVLRLPRVVITWFVLRGWRDLVEAKKPGTKRPSFWTMLRLWWAATEVRNVRYDLELALKTVSGLADDGQAPARLWLGGDKKITYAASWCEIVRHAWSLLRSPDDPAIARRPGDLRASLLHQLTQPRIRIDSARWKRMLPAALSDACARFAFDTQRALQRTPIRVEGGVDSTTAAFAALAYPAFLVRYLLQSRVLEFRLPTYSDQPLPDAASAQDVWLRAGPRGRVDPQEITLKVPMGRSSSDDGTERPAGDTLGLRLWRYARTDAHGAPTHPTWEEGTWCGHKVRRARSVVLMHAFDMSGHSFTFKTTSRNFAEHLYEKGWEVWILDSRMSPRTSASIEPCTVDQLGFIDAPHAVDFILAALKKELPANGNPLQIYGFGQCMGAASLLIGLMGGRLSYPIQADARYASATGERPLMPKLAGLVTSQTHPFIVGSRSAQSKTWMPALLRDHAGRTMVPLGVRGPVTSVVESLADRLFAGFPVPRGERCHGEGALHRIDDDCATCRRIRFLLGGMFLHRNLNLATHQELPKLFGTGSVRLFAQGAKFFQYERLCSEDGHNVYTTDANIGRYLALPLRFMHGAENGLFDQESAIRSAEQYARIQPGWAQRYGLRMKGGGRRHVCDVIDGYGHVDVLIGQRAMGRPEDDGHAAVYDRMSALLESAWRKKDAAPSAGPQPRTALVARFPRSGPFLGPVIEKDGRRSVGISFIVDDTNADIPDGAVALVGTRGLQLPVPLEIRNIQVAVPARDNQYHAPDTGALIGLRVAFGRVDVTDEPTDRDLRIRCVSYTSTAVGAALPAVAAAVRLPPPVPAARDLEQAIRAAQEEVRKQKAASDRPFPPTLSQRLRYPRQHYTMRAQVPRHVLRQPGTEDLVRVAVGCCRYTGFALERDRADAAVQRMLEREQADADAARPQLLFMLGDQIYADRTAGIVDALSPTERFFFRHHEAFTTRTARRRLSSLPTVCVPDDHEFVDSFPLGRPLLRRAPEETAGQRKEGDAREGDARVVAMRAVAAYQLAQMPATAWKNGYCEFSRGSVRFFVIDTRCWRHRRPDGTVQTMRRAARRAFEAWLAQCAADPGVLGCLATGSVILPGLYPGADPANIGPVDTMQVAQEERAWLLGGLAMQLPGRFVLLSGDYHVSFAGEVRLDGRRVGAAVVAPPFYAPLIYANARPQDLWIGERVPTPAGVVSVHAVDGWAPKSGSGYGMLDFQPQATGWTVRLQAEIVDFECGGRWSTVTWPAVELSQVSAQPPGCAGTGRS